MSTRSSASTRCPASCPSWPETAWRASWTARPHEAWFAQSSGLAEDADGNIWVADSETSALRKLVIDDDGTVTVESAVGKGLFDFGFRDGRGR